MAVPALCGYPWPSGGDLDPILLFRQGVRQIPLLCVAHVGTV